MTNEEAIINLRELLSWYLEENYDSETYYKREAIDCAIKALKEVDEHHETFEWCNDCKEYDQEHHCCYRWSKQIQKTAIELQEYHDKHLRSIANTLAKKGVHNCMMCAKIPSKCCASCEDGIYEWMKGLDCE